MVDNGTNDSFRSIADPEVAALERIDPDPNIADAGEDDDPERFIGEPVDDDGGVGAYGTALDAERFGR